MDSTPSPALPDSAAFERVLAPHRSDLHAHCYRMLGSLADADDALQETLLRAWRGLPAFEGRSALRSWLYRIATNVCLRAIERRPRRTLPIDLGPPADPYATDELAAVEAGWIDPYPDGHLRDARTSPEARYEARESVELAFIAALQHLPARQRAVLLLRDVLGFAPAEIAEQLDTTAASVSSALQRAHQAVDERLPAQTQQQTLRSLGDEHLRELVGRYVSAWEAGDVPALVDLLTADVAFSMPPRLAWFRGRADVAAFVAAQPLDPVNVWRLSEVRAGGHLAFAVHLKDKDTTAFVPHAIKLLTLDPAGAISGIVAFHAPELHDRFAPAMDRGSVADR